MLQRTLADIDYRRRFLPGGRCGELIGKREVCRESWLRSYGLESDTPQNQHLRGAINGNQSRASRI